MGLSVEQKNKIMSWASGKSVAELNYFIHFIKTEVIPKCTVVEKEEYNNKKPILCYTIFTYQWYHNLARGCFKSFEEASEALKTSGLKDMICSGSRADECSIVHTVEEVRNPELYEKLIKAEGKEISHPNLGNYSPV